MFFIVNAVGLACALLNQCFFLLPYEYIDANEKRRDREICRDPKWLKRSFQAGIWHLFWHARREQKRKCDKSIRTYSDRKNVLVRNRLTISGWTYLWQHMNALLICSLQTNSTLITWREYRVSNTKEWQQFRRWEIIFDVFIKHRAQWKK